MNDFYVGYLPKAPTALARFVRKVIIVLGLLAVTAALGLVIGQKPFADSAFEYGQVRGFEGVVDRTFCLGVMNAGQGKVHRDCAARCLSGGIPRIFITTDGITTDGREQFLLVGPDGLALKRDALREFIAEPITIRGELLQKGASRLLSIDPPTLNHSLNRIEVARGSGSPN